MSTKFIGGRYYTILKSKGKTFEFWTSTREEAYKIASELTGVPYNG